MIQAIIVILLILAAIWLITGVVAPLVGLVITVLWWIFIGYLAGRLLRGRGYGPIGDGLLGLGGGVLGGVLFGLLGIGSGGFIGSLLAGVVGAVALVYLVRLVANADFAR